MDIRDQAADIIEPHINGKHRVRDRAVSVANDLATYGLLAGQHPTVSTAVTVREAAYNLMQCRLSQLVAERIADALADAGLLANH